MTTIKAKVIGDIPANRLLWITEETKGMLSITLPKETGNYVDFVTNSELKDGEVVNINITNNRIWEVEASTDIKTGANVAVNKEGKVGSYPSAKIRIGYSLDDGKEGDIVKIVKHPKIVLDKINLEDYTVSELKDLAKEKEISGYSSMKKEELVNVLEGE